MNGLKATRDRTPRRRRLTLKALGLALSLLIAVVALGCGGRYRPALSAPAPAPAMGDARLWIDWPEGRAATNDFGANVHSLVISIRRGSTVLATQNAVKPQVVTPFVGLPSGDCTMGIFARETADASGPILGGVVVPLTVVPHQTVDVQFSLTALVDHIDVRPTRLTLNARATGAFTLTARGANGGVVLGDARALSITSTHPSVATAALPGTVTAGEIGGTTSIGFSDRSTGKTAWIEVTVLPPTGVTLTPTSAALSSGGAQRFVATVTGFPNRAVTWTVREGRSGGTVDATGLYVAPHVPGTYHVVATSVADRALAATATVSVGKGGISVGVH